MLSSAELKCRVWGGGDFDLLNVCSIFLPVKSYPFFLTVQEIYVCVCVFMPCVRVTERTELSLKCLCQIIK